MNTCLHTYILEAKPITLVLNEFTRIHTKEAKNNRKKRNFYKGEFSIAISLGHADVSLELLNGSPDLHSRIFLSLGQLEYHWG